VVSRPARCSGAGSGASARPPGSLISRVSSASSRSRSRRARSSRVRRAVAVTRPGPRHRSGRCGTCREGSPAPRRTRSRRCPAGRRSRQRAGGQLSPWRLRSPCCVGPALRRRHQLRFVTCWTACCGPVPAAARTRS